MNRILLAAAGGLAALQARAPVRAQGRPLHLSSEKCVEALVCGRCITREEISRRAKRERDYLACYKAAERVLRSDIAGPDARAKARAELDAAYQRAYDRVLMNRMKCMAEYHLAMEERRHMITRLSRNSAEVKRNMKRDERHLNEGIERIYRSRSILQAQVRRGIPGDLIRTYVCTEQIAQQYRHKHLQHLVEPTYAEKRAYYRKHRAQFRTDDLFLVRRIRVPLPEGLADIRGSPAVQKVLGALPPPGTPLRGDDLKRILNDPEIRAVTTADDVERRRGGRFWPGNRRAVLAELPEPYRGPTGRLLKQTGDRTPFFRAYGFAVMLVLETRYPAGPLPLSHPGVDTKITNLLRRKKLQAIEKDWIRRRLARISVLKPGQKPVPLCDLAIRRREEKPRGDN